MNKKLQILQNQNYQIQTPILQSKFYLDKEHSKEIQGFYYQKQKKILFCQISEFQSNHITFQISLPSKFTFQIIRNVLFMQKENFMNVHIKKYLGIRFQECLSEFFFQIYSHDSKIIELWKNKLQKIMNHNGFHQLYKPYKKIAKGTNATIYYALRVEDSCKTAIKAFSKEFLSSQPKGLQILDNQIQILRSLDHKNIIQLYEVLQTQNSLYLSLQYLQGGQLYEFVKKPKIKYFEIKTILKQILEALKYLNQKGIVHRDLKPENILFRKADSLDIVIADFGLSTRINDPSPIFLRCGTPGYVAPQILNSDNFEQQTTKCDIFSVGVLLYHLIFKRKLFGGADYKNILQNNKKCEFELIGQIYQKIDVRLLDLISLMLKKKASQRISPSVGLQHQFFKVNFDQQRQIEVNISGIQIQIYQYKYQKQKKNKYVKVQGSFGIFFIAKQPMILVNSQSSQSQNSNPLSPFTPDPKKFNQKKVSNKESRFSLMQHQKSSYFKINSQPRKKNLQQKSKKITLNDLQSKD